MTSVSPVPAAPPSDSAGMASVSVTSLWVAGLRALENERADRVFTDPYARDLAGEEFGNVAALTGSEEGHDLNPLLLRTRFGDAVLDDAVRSGVRQVVLVGAGMDTRAFRLSLPEDLTLWEVDLPAPLGYKDRVLEGRAARPRCRRVTVEADLAGPWDAALEHQGFRPDRPCLWLVEGVFLYLDPGTAASVATALTRLSAPGSVLAFDAYGAAAFDSFAMRGWNTAFDESGTSLGPAMEEPVGWIGGFGWAPEAWTRQDVRDGHCPWAPPQPARVADAFLDHSWLVRAVLPAASAAAPGKEH